MAIRARSARLRAADSELAAHEELFIKRYDRLPKELLSVRDLIISSMWQSLEQRELLRFDDEGRYEHGSLIDRSALARRHAACQLDRATS